MISDDSGLSIKSLKNMPGVYSARLAKKKGSFFKAMIYLLKKLKTKIDQQLLFAAYLLKIQKKVSYGRGKNHGTISKKIIGGNGFGYDPIFIPKNHQITFGQMAKLKKLNWITDILLLEN